jgi:hypothetical protein
MNIDEYKDRIEKMHTLTGVPTYWEELQRMTAERNRWRILAIHAWCHMGVDATCSSDDCEQCQAIEEAWKSK